MNGIPNDSLWLSLILGANLGGNFTPIGSPSNIIALNMYYRMVKNPDNQKDFFKTFFRIGIMQSIILMSIATVYISVSLFFGSSIAGALAILVSIIALLLSFRPWEHIVQYHILLMLKYDRSSGCLLLPSRLLKANLVCQSH